MQIRELGQVLGKQIQKLPFIIILCFILLFLVVIIAFFAPFLVPHAPHTQNLLLRLTPPSFMEGGVAGYFLGTDHLGRDVLSRTIISLRTSLLIAFFGVIVGFVTGGGLGLISGSFRGKIIETLIMFLVDVQLSIPFTLIALVAVAIFGTDLTILVIVVGLGAWPRYARIVRGEVLSIREREFISASIALGASEWTLIFRHILPNIISPLIVLSTYQFTQIMLLESTLSFLGLGVQPPDASLGLMIGVGRGYLGTAWWMAFGPTFMLIIVAMVLSLLGDWLRDVLDPNL